MTGSPTYALLYATGHGEMKLSDHRGQSPGDYLLRGGFLHVDDITVWTRASGARSRGSFPTDSW